MLTDDQGAFEITALQPGTIPVRVFAKGFARWSGEVDCRSGSLAHVPVDLRHGASLSGRVFDPSGEPVPGATLVLAREVPQNGARVTDAEGRYHYEDLAEGEWSMHVFSAHHGSLESTVHIARESEHRADFRFAPGPAIRGVLLDHLGKPLERWIVQEEGTERDFWGEHRELPGVPLIGAPRPDRPSRGGAGDPP